MPQLDKLSFVPQLFWLFVFFLSLYLIVVEILLPKIHTIIQVRALKNIMHSVRISALNNEKATNKIYVVLFAKLFKNTDLFFNYLKAYSNITPVTYGSSYNTFLKGFRQESVSYMENSFFETQVKKQIVQELLIK